MTDSFLYYLVVQGLLYFEPERGATAVDIVCRISFSVTHSTREATNQDNSQLPFNLVIVTVDFQREITGKTVL